MKRLFLREVRNGERLPTFHRVAWHDPWERVAIAAPIGLHWIARNLRRAWIWSFMYEPNKAERLEFELAGTLNAYRNVMEERDRLMAERDALEREVVRLKSEADKCWCKFTAISTFKSKAKVVSEPLPLGGFMVIDGDPNFPEGPDDS